MFSPALVLYERKSSLSGAPLISVYHPSKSFPLYSIQEWWSDAWDALAYGREFDSGKTFFEQFGDLFSRVPKMANFSESGENSDYCTSAANAKNCYYCRTVHRSQDCYYSELVTGYNEMLCDCLRCQRSGWLYECVQCVHCHSGAYLFRCHETRDSFFCTDLRGCSNCLFCTNLRNKSYYIHNAPVSREEFARAKEAALDGRFVTLERSLGEFGTVYTQTIWQNLNNVNCENCTGDNLANCSNAYECFHCFNLMDCRYCWWLSPSEQCSTSMDLTRGGIGELLYNSAGLGGGNYFIRMSASCRKSRDLTYCIDCYECNNCFGCTGLRHKEFCVLNKQYSKEEYQKLTSRIIEHMKKEGVWGTFFPVMLSSFPYNDSSADILFPLSRDEVLQRGWEWAKPMPQHFEESTRSGVPDAVDDVQDTICQEVFSCEETGRKFKIILPELRFYRKMHVPLPRLHPDVRIKRRRSMLNPCRLFSRSCKKCAQPIQTSYPPERKEIVYCEKCYLEAVY